LRNEKQSIHETIGEYSMQTYKALYTISEEIVHGITHGIGTGLSISGLTILVVLAVMSGDIWRIISFSIFGSTLVLLYLASTLYHSIQHPRAKQIFQRMDHAAIYLLIAGTYTPFLLVAIRGNLGWTLLVIIWGLALIGVGFKALFIHRFPRLSVLGYVLMGWLGVVAFNQLLGAIPPTGFFWLAAGGAAYTVGILFLAWRRIPFNHAIWHLFVMAGSFCHFIAVIHLLPNT
jgi:hemolysin III